MRFLKTSVLVPLTCLLAATLFYFRPGGVVGPRVEPIPAEGKGFSHDTFSKVLSTVVDDAGRVNYALLKNKPGLLDRYLGQLAATSPKNAPHRFRKIEDRLAYYINAYNAFVLAAIRDHCPLQSVQDVFVGEGFYWRISFVLGGEEISLTQLQAERIRSVMQNNPVVHFALVGGAKGHFPLGQTAYDGATLNTQFNALRERLGSLKNMLTRDGNSLRVSEIFRWYQSDFGRPEAWLKQVKPNLVAETNSVQFIPFDWSLNGHCHAVTKVP